jgi:hypothetical protein
MMFSGVYIVNLESCIGDLKERAGLLECSIWCLAATQCRAMRAMSSFLL